MKRLKKINEIFHILVLILLSNTKNKSEIFSNFVAFSEYMNLESFLLFSKNYFSQNLTRIHKCKTSQST